MRLTRGGATLIQLREKHATPGEFCREAKAALEIARERGARLIINDRVDIALAVGADGVHLGQSDVPPEAARRLLGEDAIIGVSSHNLAQARLAATTPVDYVAFGPIFSTSTKENPDAVAGLDALKAVRASLGTLPLVAIGGINLTNAEQVLQSGADSLAIIAALLSDPAKITENTRLMLSGHP